MMTGLALTLALFGALMTVRMSMRAALFSAVFGRFDKLNGDKLKWQFVRLALAVAGYTALTIIAAFTGGIYL